MAELSGPTRAAKSGNSKYMVVFVHGYGADGNDLIGLAEPLAEHLPDVVFHAPNAPQRCTGNPMGFQWFPIPWLDSSSEAEATEGMASAAALLNEWLDETMKAEGVDEAHTLLVGFSQGTMMSLHIAPRRAEPLAGVVGFSGRLMAPETLEDEALSRLPILLIHGDEDPVVPLQSLPEAADALTKVGYEVYTHISKGTGHGIAPDGLQLALQFIQQQLP
ncbi:MAG: prolyl oligopeptidase family serine peptidase [Rhodobacteraceae bacterium]|nr:prolyl oligopeptidase family serine peptidase [Paracoccaceae bacterium]